MIKIIITGFILVYHLIGSAQGNYDYELRFSPKKPGGLYVIEFLSNKVFHSDTGRADGGIIIFKGKIDYVTPASIIHLIDKKTHYIDVLLEPLTAIQIKEQKEHFYKYSGSKLQVDYDSWFAYVGSSVQLVNSVSEELNEARNSRNTELLIKKSIQLNKVMKDASEKKYKYMKLYPSSLVTALMLPDLAGHSWDNVLQASEIFGLINEQWKAHPLVRKFEAELKVALTVAPGSKFPNISLTDTAGMLQDTDSFLGKYVLIDFWASWCKPCRDESPFLLDAYSKYATLGFEIVSISLDAKKENWKRAIKKDGYIWTNLIDKFSGPGPGEIQRKLNVMSIPRNFLLNREGKVIATNLRGGVLEKKLKEVFKN